MALSAENLNVFIALFESVQASFDFVQRSPPPSPVARVRGTLRNSVAILKVMEGQLETREPRPGDVNDLRRIRISIETILADPWVTDGLAETDLDWTSDSSAAAAGVNSPARPLRLAGAVAMLVGGLTGLES